jgi:hypothetical protein
MHSEFWSENLKGFGRPRRRWEDNTKWILKIEDMDWIILAQDRDQWRALTKAVDRFP